MFNKMNSFTISSLEILTFLGLHYRESFYVREIAKTLSISTGTASIHLKSLGEAGLVKGEQKGRTLLYRANISHPVVREVKILSTLLELTPLITVLENNVSRLILFGSCATGEDTADSDIDLFIETNDRALVSDLISQHEQRVCRKLSPIIMSTEEFRQIRTRDRPLFERISRGNYLIGEEL